MIDNAILTCASFDCPRAVDLDRLADLLVLGPSLLLALTSLFLGNFGLILTDRRPTSPKKSHLLMASAVGGFFLVLIFGCIFFNFYIWALAVTG